MTWGYELMGWLAEKFVYDEVGTELNRCANLLRTGSCEERTAAARQLTYMKAEDSVALLIGALRDEAPPVRVAAAAGLGFKRTAEAIMPLALLLGDAEPQVRMAAVAALHELGTERAVSWVRFWNRDARPGVADGRIADLLERALGDPDPLIGKAALAALPRHGARGVQIMRNHLEACPEDDRESRLQAAEEELQKALSSLDPAHREAAVEALRALYGERALPALSAALADPDARVRQVAVEAVTQLGPSMALQELLQRLDDSNEQVVVHVLRGLIGARALGKFDTHEQNRIHDEILKLVRRSDGQVRTTAIWALGELGNVSCVATLAELLQPKAPEAILVAASEALGKINDPRAFPALVSMLDRSLPSSVSSAAVGSLARGGDVRVLPEFVRMLFEETRPQVEVALEEAISSLCRDAESEAGLATLEGSPEEQLRSIKHAISDPRLVFSLIHHVLESTDARLRAAATEVLSKQGFALEALVRSTLRLEDKSEARRILAINLGVALRLSDAEELLETLLRDTNEPPEVYRHAVAALKRLDSPAALAALRKHAEEGHEKVRELAKQAAEAVQAGA